MDIVIRRARPSDAPALTRVAHAAKRHWKYPGDWIRLWRDALTVTLGFVERHPVVVRGPRRDPGGLLRALGRGAGARA